MSITIEAKDAAAVIRAFDRKARETVKRAMMRGAERGRGILVRRTPTDTGHARAAWRVLSSIIGQEIARITNDAPHIGIIEAGARPHAVSDVGILAIEAWVHRHGLGAAAREATHLRNVGERALGMAGDRKVPTIEQAEHAIAMGIVWKLRHEGQEPTYFIKHSLPDLRLAMKREVERALKLLAKGPPKKGGR